MSMIGNFVAVPPERLDGFRLAPESLEGFLWPDDDTDRPEHALDVDKAWHGIHFLLTGDPWEGTLPLANAVLGGETLGDEDLGYGPARFLTPEEVVELAEALEGQPREKLAAGYDPAALEAAEIYPEGIWEPEALDYLLNYYDELVEFYRQAAARGDAVILYLS